MLVGYCQVSTWNCCILLCYTGWLWNSSPHRPSSRKTQWSYIAWWSATCETQRTQLSLHPTMSQVCRRWWWSRPLCSLWFLSLVLPGWGARRWGGWTRQWWRCRRACWWSTYSCRNQCSWLPKDSGGPSLAHTGCISCSDGICLAIYN